VTRAFPVALLTVLAACVPSDSPRRVTVVPGGIQLVLIAPGDFTMGMPPSEPAR